jgi:hypothetical protein
MATKKVVDEYYVKVLPESSHWRIRPHVSDKDLLNECKKLQSQIQRHCDTGGVSVEYEAHFECEFCHSKLAGPNDWGCCDASVDEYKKAGG